MVIYYVIFFLHFWKNYSEQICLHFFNQNLPLNLIFFPHVDKMPMCTLTKVEKQKKQKKTCVIRNFLIFKISFTCTASFFSSVFLFFVFFCYIYKIWIYNFFFLLKLIIFICILTFFTRGEHFQHFFFFLCAFMSGKIIHLVLNKISAILDKKTNKSLNYLDENFGTFWSFFFFT